MVFSGMMFDHRLILLATPRQIGVLDWRPGHMHWLGEFAANETGRAAFRQALVKRAQLPVLLGYDFSTKTGNYLVLLSVVLAFA